VFKKIKPTTIKSDITTLGFPHCDPRVLHAPGECVYCDSNPGWQELRQAWGIAFTGYTPEEKELPCPADYARGDTHALWPGNRAAKGENV
jgi:hypothetical protein